VRFRAFSAVMAALVAAAASAGAPPPKAPATRATPSRPRPAAPTFEVLSARAAEARAEGRIEDAATHYAKAVALRPAWSEGRLALGTVLFDLERYAEARAHLQRVTAEAPADGVAWALLGLSASRLKDYGAALDALGRAEAAGITSAELLSAVRFETALLLNRTGRHDAAFDLLRPYAQQGKDTPTVIVAFGLCMLRLPRMPDEVPPEKREMVRLAGRGGYHMARARRTALGRLALEELVSRFPSEPNVHYALGLYIAPDDPDAALEEFRRELRLTPDHLESLIQTAHLETRRGSAETALPFAEKAVAQAPDVPAGRLALGRALLELGRTDESIVHLERAAALAPESGDVQFALSRAYQRAGRTEAAARAREEFLRLTATSPQ
jgi:tetratricopeptide (TPR) repeat protein